jgi:hypothetical protein
MSRQLTSLVLILRIAGWFPVFLGFCAEDHINPVSLAARFGAVVNFATIVHMRVFIRVATPIITAHLGTIIGRDTVFVEHLSVTWNLTVLFFITILTRSGPILLVL